MAEVTGLVASGMTLAGLFKICIEAFDMIQTGRHQEMDLKKLTLRLNIEKCRLYTWGQAIGLTETIDQNGTRPLDLCQFQDIVREALETVFQIFNNTHKIKETYGCRPFPEQDATQLRLAATEGTNPVENLATPFANFKIGGNKSKRSSKLTQKAKWVIHDRQKFGFLIAEVKDLIDGLQDTTNSLVAVADQRDMMRKGIGNIKSVKTLGLVAEVCENDHLDLSEAASMRADTISMATTTRQNIATWTESLNIGEDINSGSADLESLTVTELKHLLWQLLQERQTTNPDLRLLASPIPKDRDIDSSDPPDTRIQKEGIELTGKEPAELEFEHAVFVNKIHPRRLHLPCPEHSVGTDTLQSVNTRGQQQLWGKYMKGINLQRRYRKVSALMIHWEREGEDLFDAQDEINRLRRTFETHFHFNVSERKLNIMKNRSVQVQINKHLSNFVYEEDAEDTLLIIYYAGHGTPDSVTGQLLLAGGNLPASEEIPDDLKYVVWQNIEHLIHSAHRADIFLIMDCSHAGKLLNMHHEPFSGRIFEFLGAAGADEVSYLPGPESFTSALIWALEELAKEKEPFMTSELLQKIIMAPRFPPNQRPVLAELGMHYPRRLILEPVATEIVLRAQKKSGETLSSIEYCLNLQFLLPALPTDKDIHKMCEGLKGLIKA